MGKRFFGQTKQRESLEEGRSLNLVDQNGNGINGHFYHHGYHDPFMCPLCARSPRKSRSSRSFRSSRFKKAKPCNCR